MPCTDSWQARFAELLEAGTAPSTHRAHRRDLDYFRTWHLYRFDEELNYPVPLDSIMTFLTDHLGGMPGRVERRLLEGGWRKKGGRLAIPTLRRYLSSLSYAHDSRGVDNPCRHPQVKLLLKKARVAQGSHGRGQSAAITLEILEAMLAVCDDDLRGVRDRALFLTGFSAGGRRRSELSGLDVRDLYYDEAGNAWLYISKSKTDQVGEGLEVPLPESAGKALRDWIAAAQLTNGSLFRGITAAGRLTASLSGHSINRIVKERLAKAGINPAPYGAHSLRSGFLTEAGRGGVQLREAMALSGHRSLSVAQGYYRTSSMRENPAASLMGRLTESVCL